MFRKGMEGILIYNPHLQAAILKSFLLSSFERIFFYF